jgi:hypothetical protein
MFDASEQALTNVTALAIFHGNDLLLLVLTTGRKYLRRLFPPA